MDNKRVRIVRFDADPTNRLERLRVQSLEEGYGHVDRLVRDYATGDNRFDRPGEALFGVYDSGTLVGVGGLNVDPYLADDKVGRVRRVYIRPDRRGRGLGRALIDAIADHARPHFRMLTVRAGRADAAAFYEAIGFQPEPPIEMATHHKWLGRLPGVA